LTQYFVIPVVFDVANPNIFKHALVYNSLKRVFHKKTGIQIDSRAGKMLLLVQKFLAEYCQQHKGELTPTVGKDGQQLKRRLLVITKEYVNEVAKVKDKLPSANDVKTQQLTVIHST
jgi:hypothetical protein